MMIVSALKKSIYSLLKNNLNEHQGHFCNLPFFSGQTEQKCPCFFPLIALLDFYNKLIFQQIPQMSRKQISSVAPRRQIFHFCPATGNIAYVVYFLMISFYLQPKCEIRPFFAVFFFCYNVIIIHTRQFSFNILRLIFRYNAFCNDLKHKYTPFLTYKISLPYI